MGNENASYKLAEYQYMYNEKHAPYDVFFGNHNIMISKKDNHVKLISKTLLFHADTEY